MKQSLRMVPRIVLVVLLLQGCTPRMPAVASEWLDMLTPAYYQVAEGDS